MTRDLPKVYSEKIDFHIWGLWDAYRLDQVRKYLFNRGVKYNKTYNKLSIFKKVKTGKAPKMFLEIGLH